MTLDSLRILRLGVKDSALAQRTFRVMAEVFDETVGPLSDAYLHAVLARPEFWAFAAVRGDVPVAGITAHALPMTRSEAVELFIYDIAVHPTQQRRGIGRALVHALLREAAAHGIHVAFVPADAEDAHALDFYRALGGTEGAVSIFTFEQAQEG